jgi:hypothetical protein
MKYSTDIKDYYRRAWGLGDRVPFKYGGTWADWATNYEDQMTFEEYLQDDTIVKKLHALDRKAKGGRVKRQNYVVPGLVLGYEAIAALTAATGLGIEAVRRYSQANPEIATNLLNSIKTGAGNIKDNISAFVDGVHGPKSKTQNVPVDKELTDWSGSFADDQTFKTVTDTPAGAWIGPNLGEIEKEKEKIRERLKPPVTHIPETGPIHTGHPPPEIKKWEPPVSGGKIDIPLTTGGSEIPETKKEDLIFTSQTAEKMLEGDDHSQDQDVLEVKETFDKVMDLYNTGRSAEIDAVRSKEFAEKVKNIIDTKYGGTVRNLADDIGIERVRINSLFNKHGIKTDRSGNITQQKVFDLWQPEDKQFLKDFTTNAKYDKNFINDRVEKSLGKDFDKDQWKNWKDLSEIWGLKHRIRVDQLKTDSTDFQARLNKLGVKKKKGKGKEVLWHLGDAIIKLQKKSLTKPVAGTGTWHNKKRRDFQEKTDSEGYKVEDQIKQDIRELTKDVLGENFVPYALEESGHGVSINNQLSFEDLFKDSNASWISSKVMQDPVLNKEILAARNSIEKGIENSERKELLILEELLGKDFNQLTQKIAQDAVETMNQRRTNVKTDPRLIKNKFLKDQADRVPLYKLTLPKRGETFKSGFLNIDMSSIEPSVSVGKILEINPNAKSFSDLTKKQQELYKENLKNQYIDFATYYYKKRGLDNEDIKDLFDALTEGKEKKAKGKEKKATGGLTGVDQYILNRYK